MKSPNSIDTLYRERIDRMTIAGRVQRAADLFAWSRGFVSRQVLRERGPLAGERFKREVALRQYGADPMARALIEGVLARASD